MGATPVEKLQSEKENINIFLPKREHVSGGIPQGLFPIRRYSVYSSAACTMKSEHVYINSIPTLCRGGTGDSSEGKPLIQNGPVDSKMKLIKTASSDRK